MKKLSRIASLLFIVLSSACRPDPIQEIIAGMPLRDKVAQLIVAHHYDPIIDSLVAYDHIGGVIVMVSTKAEVDTLLPKLQASSRIPLFTCIDAEWGAQMRMKQDYPAYPRAMAIGRSADPCSFAREVGYQTGLELKALGIAANLAPVADVNTNPANPVIGTRSFGDTPQKVYELAKSYSDGLHDAGVFSCAKHFPGHGDTSVDSHKALPVLAHDRARLDSVELYPFRRLIEDGAVEMVMTGHLSVPALDSTATPASISKPINDFLRDSLGFAGVIVTDGMNMRGVTSLFGGSDIPGSVEALKAGADLILAPVSCRGIIDAFTAVVANGEYPEEELDKKVYRVLKLKQKAGLIQN